MPLTRFSIPRIAFVTGFALLVAALLLVLHLERTVQNAARARDDGHHLVFQFGPLRLPPDLGFEPVAAPSQYSHAAALGGAIFLAGPSALVQYRGDAAHLQTFLPGRDLPSARLGEVVTGRLRGAQHPQVLVATAGAGILIYDPETNAWQQMLPQQPHLRDVTSLAVTASGDLLFGTRQGGLLQYDGYTLQVFRPEYRDTAVTALTVDGDDVWVGTQDDGVFQTHGGITTHFLQQMPDRHIESFARDGAHVYAGTAAGVQEFVSGTPTRTLAAGSFVRALTVQQGTLYVAALHEGTLQIPLAARSAHETWQKTDDASPVEAFVHLPADQDTITLRQDGLYQPHSGAPERVVSTGKAMLADGNISALGFARDGKLWVGYFDRGLDIVDLNLATAYHLEDDHLFCINRITIDPQRQTMAVATANGLVLFDSAGQPRQVLGRRDGLIAEHVTDIAYSRGQMVVATPAGLSFVRDNGVESLYAFQGLVNNHVYALAASADGGQLEAGTLGGMSVLQNDAVVHNLTVANSGLQHNWITAIVPVPHAAGEYLVGTYGRGVLLQHKDGGFEGMNTRGAGELIINPNAMLATDAHVLAGSLNGGLWSYSIPTGHWTQVTAGLPSENVTALAERDGMLYVGTDNGLVRVAEARLP